jgi:hypothetical protein
MTKLTAAVANFTNAVTIFQSINYVQYAVQLVPVTVRSAAATVMVPPGAWQSVCCHVEVSASG